MMVLNKLEHKNKILNWMTDSLPSKRRGTVVRAPASCLGGGGPGFER